MIKIEDRKEIVPGLDMFKVRIVPAKKETSESGSEEKKVDSELQKS